MIYIFGIIGVPVHEFSHFIFCLLFGHKVNEVKLFSPNLQTGVLGYVTHSYNKKSIYQSIGQVFISIAPMIVGTFLISLLTKLFNIDSFSLKAVMSNPSLIYKYMIFIYIFMCISSHMVWSTQDIKNCFSGIIGTSILIVICILLFPNLFLLAFNALIIVAKFAVINLFISFLLFIILSIVR